MRKFWFAYLAKALVIFPGGFGTLRRAVRDPDAGADRQAVEEDRRHAVRPRYWEQVLDFKPMAEWGAIAEKDLELLHYADTPADAFEQLRDHLIAHHLEPRRRRKPRRRASRKRGGERTWTADEPDRQLIEQYKDGYRVVAEALAGATDERARRAAGAGQVVGARDRAPPGRQRDDRRPCACGCCSPPTSPPIFGYDQERVRAARCTTTGRSRRRSRRSRPRAASTGEILERMTDADCGVPRGHAYRTRPLHRRTMARDLRGARARARRSRSWSRATRQTQADKTTQRAARGHVCRRPPQRCGGERPTL